MSHHYSEMSQSLSDMIAKANAAVTAADKKLGATGRFPRGKLTPEDEGEILMRTVACKKNGVVFLEFGKQVEGIGFTYEQAMALADDLTTQAFALRGISS